MNDIFLIFVILDMIATTDVLMMHLSYRNICRAPLNIYKYFFYYVIFPHDEQLRWWSQLQYIITSHFDEVKINAITGKYSIYSNSLSVIIYSVLIAITVIG